MNAKSIILTALAGVGVYALARTMLAENQRAAERTNARVVSVVEKTLQQHAGKATCSFMHSKRHYTTKQMVETV